MLLKLVRKNVFVLFFLLALSLLLTVDYALAEEINWPGNGALVLDPYPFNPLLPRPDIDMALVPTASFSNNHVTVNDAIQGSVYGGFKYILESGNATSNSNTVSLTSTTPAYFIWGGFARVDNDGNAESNENVVNITSSEIGSTLLSASVVGGRGVVGHGSSKANGNRVIIGNSKVTNVVAAGQNYIFFIGNAETIDNCVSIVKSEINADVFGGYNLVGENGVVRSNENKVVLEDTSVTAPKLGVFGGYINSVSNNGSFEANSNMVKLINSQVAGNVLGGNSNVEINVLVAGRGNGSQVEANGNVLIFTDSIGKKVYGGNAVISEPGFINADGRATANSNTVNISGSTVTEGVYGGEANISVVGQTSATANFNHVIINRSKINDNIYGGQAHSSGTGLNQASYNIIEIDTNKTIPGHSEIVGRVYGGKVNSGAGDKAIGNTVIIGGSPNLGQSYLYGGDVAGGGDQFSGNRLVVRADQTIQLLEIKNFEIYDLLLPPVAKSGYDVIKVDQVFFGDGNNVSRLLDMRTEGGGWAPQEGETVNLFVHNDGSTVDTANLTAEDGSRTVKVQKGLTLLYTFTIGQDGKLTVGKVRANPQAKIHLEGRLASLSLINQGQDLLAGAAIREIAGAPDQQLSAFTAFTGGKSRYNTGSHVDVEGYSLVAGLGWGNTTEAGKLALGTFFEYGYGNYDGYNDFVSYPSLHTSGKARYIGGGILGRYDFSHDGYGNFYAEASGRLGRLENDFKSINNSATYGQINSYQIASLYHGLHLGTGYLWDVAQETSLDLYGQYYWNRLRGASLSLSTQDPIDFEATNSHRLRVGARLSNQFNDWLNPFVGAAYEHEFYGQSQGTSYGYRLESPDLRGGSGLGELGLTVKKADSPVSLDLVVQGYAGVREGVAGSFRFKFDF